MERLTGFGPAIFDLASRRSDQLSYNRMEPARRIELRLPPYHGEVLPLPLSRHELGAQVSNLETSRSKRDGSASSPTAQRSLLPDPNRDLPLTRRVRCRLRQGGKSRALRPTLGGAVRLTPGIVRSARFELAQPSRTTSTSGWRVYLFRHERIEPLDGLEPPACPVRRGRSAG